MYAHALTVLSTLFLATRFYAKQYTTQPSAAIDEILIVTTTYLLALATATITLAVLITLEQAILAIAILAVGDLTLRTLDALYQDITMQSSSDMDDMQ